MALIWFEADPGFGDGLAPGEPRTGRLASMGLTRATSLAAAKCYAVTQPS